MFKDPMAPDPERLRRAARGWAVGNIGRALILVVALLAALQAVTALAMRLGV
jgi:hypothetical protein